MSAHTPGPWGLDGNLIEGPDGERVACITAYSRRTPKQKANARLIAAAPDLLAALRGMLAIVNDSRGVAGYHLNGNTAEWDEFDEVDAARAAIAKTTGGTA